MPGRIIGFIIWSTMGFLFVCLAVYSCFSKKAMRFWANADAFEVTDKKKYNHAVAKLFFIFGIVLIVLGIPLLVGQNSPWILLSVTGLVMESIIAMVVYSLVIEKKYKKSR